MDSIRKWYCIKLNPYFSLIVFEWIRSHFCFCYNVLTLHNHDFQPHAVQIMSKLLHTFHCHCSLITGLLAPLPIIFNVLNFSRLLLISIYLASTQLSPILYFDLLAAAFNYMSVQIYTIWLLDIDCSNEFNYMFT